MGIDVRAFGFLAAWVVLLLLVQSAQGQEAATTRAAPPVEAVAPAAPSTPDAANPAQARVDGPRPIDVLAERIPERWRRRGRFLRDRWAPSVEHGLLSALDRAPTGLRPALRRWSERVTETRGRRLGLALAGGLLLVLAIWRIARRPGDVVVSLEYPSELSGSFSVYLTRRRRSSIESRKQRAENRERASTAREHHAVARETQFRGVAPRSYWLTVEGTLREPGSEAALLEPFESRQIEVRSGRTERVGLDFRPRACPVELQVIWDARSVQDASVAVSGHPDMLRFARGGRAQLMLPLGTHRIAIGSGDRVAELELELTDFQAHTLTVDLGRPDHIVFKGCPGAVTPYLKGDLQAAAQALDRDGQNDLACRLKARMLAASGRAERAAEYLEEVGLFRDAAQLRESLDDLLGAASSFQRTGDRGDQTRAIELLQRVDSDDPNYGAACHLLAEALEERGDFEGAASWLERTIEAQEGDAPSHEMQARLAGLVERSGDLAGSLDMLQKIQGEDPEFPNLVTRIDDLRKKLSAGRAMPTFSAAGAGGNENPEAAGRYEILEQVGRGGMAVVFKARDRRLGRVVALKKLPENLRDHPQVVELFVREARAVAALNHRNIVTIFDADREDDTYFITMELLEGCSVSQLRRQHGRLNVRDASMLCRQVCSGLAYAHERRIIHRDIKPGNLFLTRDRIVKIMDFGLAKMLEEVRRQTTVVGGTPFYVAPEQVMGDEVDGRADLYSLGISLFELLTGDVPFREGDVTHHHRHTPPPDPREREATIPDALAELILEMLEKDRENRPADADEVRERLEPFTQG
ncbi:MAG: protein kinase [Deltaproteobacteria bacterium]|nr:protein kinase [Deltaproteobacteria bacterium]